MRKLLCLLTLLALTFAAVGAFAATKTYRAVPKTTSGLSLRQHHQERDL